MIPTKIPTKDNAPNFSNVPKTETEKYGSTDAAPNPIYLSTALLSGRQAAGNLRPQGRFDQLATLIFNSFSAFSFVPLNSLLRNLPFLRTHNEPSRSDSPTEPTAHSGIGYSAMQPTTSDSFIVPKAPAGSEYLVKSEPINLLPPPQNPAYQSAALPVVDSGTPSEHSSPISPLPQVPSAPPAETQAVTGDSPTVQPTIAVPAKTVVPTESVKLYGYAVRKSTNFLTYCRTNEYVSEQQETALGDLRPVFDPKNGYSLAARNLVLAALDEVAKDPRTDSARATHINKFLAELNHTREGTPPLKPFAPLPVPQTKAKLVTSPGVPGATLLPVKTGPITDIDELYLRSDAILSSLFTLCKSNGSDAINQQSKVILETIKEMFEAINGCLDKRNVVCRDLVIKRLNEFVRTYRDRGEPWRVDAIGVGLQTQLLKIPKDAPKESPVGEPKKTSTIKPPDDGRHAAMIAKNLVGMAKHCCGNGYTEKLKEQFAKLDELFSYDEFKEDTAIAKRMLQELAKNNRNQWKPEVAELFDKYLDRIAPALFAPALFKS